LCELVGTQFGNLPKEFVNLNSQKFAGTVHPQKFVRSRCCKFVDLLKIASSSACAEGVSVKVSLLTRDLQGRPPAERFARQDELLADNL